MRRVERSDAQFARTAHLSPGNPEVLGATAQDHHRFVHAVLGIARTGAGGRDLPDRFGDGNHVDQQCHRWAPSGDWARVLEVLGGDADREWLIRNATLVRAHPHAAGAATTGPTTTRRAVARGAAAAPRSTAPSTPWATRPGGS
jgi:transposase